MVFAGEFHIERYLAGNGSGAFAQFAVKQEEGNVGFVALLCGFLRGVVAVGHHDDRVDVLREKGLRRWTGLFSTLS